MKNKLIEFRLDSQVKYKFIFDRRCPRLPKVAVGFRLGQLLRRFFRALQTSQVLHNSMVHAKA